MVPKFALSDGEKKKLREKKGRLDGNPQNGSK